MDAKELRHRAPSLSAICRSAGRDEWEVTLDSNSALRNLPADNDNFGLSNLCAKSERRKPLEAGVIGLWTVKRTHGTKMQALQTARFSRTQEQFYH